MQTTVVQVLEFLTDLFDKLGYSAMNTARAALSTIVTLPDGHSLATHPFVTRFFKGVYNLKPPKPRYEAIWDVQIVLNYLRKLSPAHELRLRDLTYKTCMLVALVSAQRQQTLHKLNMSYMTVQEKSITFFVQGLLKQSKPGKTGLTVEFVSYDPDKRLCVYNYLMEYMKRTKTLRGEEKTLFVSHRKPHGKISKDTIARWIRCVMSAAGIDTNQFKPHSTRAAATSKADTAKLPVTEIMKQAGWSKEATFQNYYNKPVATSSTFGRVVIDS